ncbi:NADAR family protein [Teredinibacter turnerae]|uniref:NADAR family protein n=1 Tax=Teredinibacter turnerae TaxID=2426 RepID=UPI0030D382B5
MFAHDLTKENAVRFSRFDPENLFSTVSAHPLELEAEVWPSAEHYFQAQLAGSDSWREKIKAAPTPAQAYKLGCVWYKRKVRGWKNLRRVMMTRALYTKVQMYPAVRDALLSTGDETILETSLYDHYWGIGRDQRGDNMLGKVWMDIRRKLRETEGEPERQAGVQDAR